MKIKNVKSPKQPGQCYIKKLQKYENKGRENSVVIASNNLYFIVDKKYEKKCRKIMKKYENALKGKKTGILVLVVTGTLATAAVAWLLTHQKPSLYNIFDIKEKTLENKELEQNAEMEHIASYEVEKRLSQAKKLKKRILEVEIIDTNLLNSSKSDTEIMLEWHLQKAEYDSYMRTYCGYFHFDYDKVIVLARKMTNNYEDFSSFLSEDDCDLTNKEAICMQFVCKLFKNELSIDWEEMGFVKEDIALTDEITMSNYDDLNTFYLHGDLKYSEFMEKYSDMFKIKDKALALAVSLEEIGKDGSRLAREQNNYGGIRIKGEWLSFPTPEAGVIYYCSMFKKTYDKYTIENADEMAKIYVGKESTEEERIRWASRVQYFYSEIQADYDFYFLNGSSLDPEPYEEEIHENVSQLIRTMSKPV